MTTLQIHYEDGVVRRCDARCYNAKGSKCKCVCLGVNHGVGFERASADVVRKAVMGEDYKPLPIDWAFLRTQPLSPSVLKKLEPKTKSGNAPW